jgi:hypothetical protein
MASGFPKREAEQLLKNCHRRCCICHRYCGVKIELDHIEQRADTSDDSIGNAIPVCFECHAEIHGYNDRHPRGRKFTPEELRGHRDQWLAICKNNPEVMLKAIRNSDVGSLQSLIDEIEFNLVVAEFNSPDEQGCLFLINQFLRAIQEGAIATLNDEIKISVLEAYQAMGRANQLIAGAAALAHGTELQKHTQTVAMQAIDSANPKIAEAKKVLLKYLGHEDSQYV